jgi:hypothetical protein
MSRARAAGICRDVDREQAKPAFAPARSGDSAQRFHSPKSQFPRWPTLRAAGESTKISLKNGALLSTT